MLLGTVGTIVSIPFPDISIANIHGIFRDQNNNIERPIPFAGGSGIYVACSYGDNNLSISHNNSGFIGFKATIVVEYIKTTDTAPATASSAVLPKSSGTITKDGVQYNYELPDIVSAASSAAKDNISSR